MRKKEKFTLRTTAEIKIFLLYILDQIRYPVDYPSLIGIISENTEKIIIDYDECLQALTDEGHIIFDQVDGEKYYMISDSGSVIAGELYDVLDKEFRERSMRYSAKYLSLSRTGSKIEAYIMQTEDGRYAVTMRASDSRGEIMNLSITVSSKEEAEKIKRNYESKPDGLYRGVMFAATGRMGFLA